VQGRGAEVVEVGSEERQTGEHHAVVDRQRPGSAVVKMPPLSLAMLPRGIAGLR
jgi:hypothetical protein